MTKANTRTVHGSWTNLRRHSTQHSLFQMAISKNRNTYIVIGADQDKGALLVDVDVQDDVCDSPQELIEQLELIIDALKGDNMAGGAE